MKPPDVLLPTFLAVVSLFGCSKTVPESQSNTEQPDPVAEFKKLFHSDGQLFKKQMYTTVGNNLKTLQVRRSPRIDVRSTESLVSPFIGEAVFEMEEVFENGREILEFKLVYSYQDQTWIPKSVQLREIRKIYRRLDGTNQVVEPDVEFHEPEREWELEYSRLLKATVLTQ